MFTNPCVGTKNTALPRYPKSVVLEYVTHIRPITSSALNVRNALSFLQTPSVPSKFSYLRYNSTFEFNAIACLLASSSTIPQLIGTWNFVNETNASMANMSMDDMNNMTRISGKIIFNVKGWEAGDMRFNQTIIGKTMTGMWMLDGHKLYLCYDGVSGPCSPRMTFTIISPSQEPGTTRHSRRYNTYEEAKPKLVLNVEFERWKQVGYFQESNTHENMLSYTHITKQFDLTILT